ncbi:ABC transporter permease [Clostridioides difficile]|uniref:ABC transporter permease n=1 Tax=Clostridioides difficile TaxID=1496 RepID=UPI00202E8A3C|nr:ABC transporter permease [Clostridioides difficile]MCM0744383.1 ABC transporter permease [Clostridioides difficile]
MLGKLAVRNTKRSLKDYLIYLITITISFSLILAFNLVVSSNEVVALSSGMGTFKDVLTFVNIVIIFVVCFLINYTTKFMFEKRSKELGTYMLLGIKKKEIARLLVMENILLGIVAFVLSIPLGFLFSQFVSLVIVKLLGIPEVVFISINLVSIGLLVIYFLAIYGLVLLNLLRRIRKMTVHDFLYFDKQNEKKMFRNNKKRNIFFIVSIVLGIVSLFLWHSRCNFEKFNEQSNMTYLMISMIMLISSIYGVSATCADMLLSVLLRSKKMKYQKDNLFVTRTFASKARTMSFTFGTLSMLILLSLLCLNFSSINKGVYKASIEMTAPFDVHVFDQKQPFDDLNEYIEVIDEDYTLNETFEYNVYKEPNHQMQNYYDVQFYDFDPVMKVSDYNKLLKLRNMNTIELKDNEYFLVTSSQLLYKVENNNDIKTLNFSSHKLHLKGIDTKSFWYNMTNTGRFMVVVPDKYVQGLEVSEEHLIVDTAEETTAKLEEKIKTELNHFLVVNDEDGTSHNEYYRVSVRGTAIEEQNTMTAMMASICLYIAFILISAVGTILAVQSLSDATKYKYRYQTLRRLGINDTSLFKTIRKQLLILFGVPVIYSIISSFFMLASINNVYQVLLDSKFTYLLYFVGGLLIFFLLYGVYWFATYIGFKRNIIEES